MQRYRKSISKNNGFTIVELLIVIVVIAVLAAISIVAYNGIQTRARDSQRKSDISAIVKAIELYYADKGVFPTSSGSTAINAGWSSTADASWANLITQLQPYASNLPLRDPVHNAGNSTIGSGGTSHSYDYYSNVASGINYCGAAAGQVFILVYKLDLADENKLIGTCSASPVGPYSPASNYRIVR